MNKVIDETGNRYGRLVVIKRVENDSRGQARWECLCDCGNKTIVIGTHLRSGHTQSCGCYGKTVGKNNWKDLTGKKFGYLTVVKRINNIGPYVTYLCRCDCGKELIIKSKQLTGNNISSCGCKRSSNGENIVESLLKENNISYQKEKTFKDLVSIKDNFTPYRFDFYLPDYNRLIEVDGLQHISKIADNYFDRTLNEVQKVDSIKNKYTKEKGIDLIRIPYKDISKITIKDILNNKYLII